MAQTFSTDYPTDTIAVEQFKNEVKHRFQDEGMGLLEKAVIRRGIIGTHTNFDLLNSTQVKRHNVAPAAELEVTTNEWARVPCYLDNFSCVQPADMFKAYEHLPDERSELAKALIMAVRRAYDQEMLDEIQGGGEANKPAPGTADKKKIAPNQIIVEANKTGGDRFPRLIGGVEEDIAAAGKGNKMSVALLMRIHRLLNEYNVPEMGRCIAMTPEHLEELQRDERYSHADFVNRKPLPDGSYPDFMNFHFAVIGQRKEGGIRKQDEDTATSKKRLVFWQSDAVGVAFARDAMIKVFWHEMRDAYFAKVTFRLGTCTREGIGTGVVNFDTKA